MWIEWALAIGAVALGLALLPPMLRRAKKGTGKSSGSGVIVAIGIAFSAIFDPKSVQATEQIDRQNDLGDSEGSEICEKP